MLALESDGDEVDTDGNLNELEIYYFIGPENAGTFSLTMYCYARAQTTYDVGSV
jgi:hypothetical protein